MTQNERESSAPRTSEDAQYRIGAVCRLTGLSPHVLRIWEKRYNVVEPERQANNRRLYSERDLAKLTLLKALVDGGHAIGTIAELSREELEDRASTVSRLQSRTDPDFRPATMVVGEALAWRADWESHPHFDVQVSYPSLDGASLHKASDALDLIVLELPGIQEDVARDVLRLRDKLNARLLVLLYNFASTSALRILDDPRIATIRGPFELKVISDVVMSRFGVQADVSDGESAYLPQPRKFSERQLAAIASQSASLECECPSHLGGLVASLARFETYSAECFSRDAEDAAIHRYLHEATGQARQVMEVALERLVEFENIEVPSFVDDIK